MWHELRFSDIDLGESDVVHMKDVDAVRWITVCYVYIFSGCAPKEKCYIKKIHGSVECMEMGVV